MEVKLSEQQKITVKGAEDIYLIMRQILRRETQPLCTKGALKNLMLNIFHGDAHKSRFLNALIIMESVSYTHLTLPTIYSV